MKKIIVFALMTLVCASMASAQIRPRVNVDGKKLNYLSDSLVIVYSPDSVKLYGSSKSNPQTVTIYGSESDKSFKYSRKDEYNPGETKVVINDNKKRKANSDSQRFDFSVPFYRKLKNEPVDWDKMLNPGNFGFALISTDSDVMNFKGQRSYEIFLDLNSCDFRSNSGRHLFSYGVGLSWKNFSMTKSRMYKDDEGIIHHSVEWPEHSDPKVSKLRVFSVTFPIMYSCNIASGFGFTLGPVVNLNTYSSIVNKYRLNDEKQKDKYKRAHCNLATVDVMFQLNFRDVGVYAKYSPMNIMDTDYWPEFKHWAIGLTLNL